MGGIRSDLRQLVSSLVLRHAERIAEGALPLDPRTTAADDADEHRRQLTGQFVRLLAHLIGDAGSDGRSGLVGELSSTVARRALDESQLFGLAEGVERAALDELAIDETVGAMSDAWGAVAQVVRHASFDLLAALVQRTTTAANAITDPVTATRTRLYFDAALATDCERAGRFGDRLALVVFRIDDTPALDARLGAGISHRIIERLGIVVRQYFRGQDLVARYADDAIAVLLVRADAEHAEQLADRLRTTIEQRLESADHRSGESIPITVSAAVVQAGGVVGAVIDPERLTVDADRALRRASEHGGNRVEAIQSAAAIRTPPRSSPSA